MNNYLPKQINFFFEKLNRKKFSDNEIFFSSYYILKQTRYSKRLDYFNFKSRRKQIFLTKIKNCCLLSGKFSSINSRLKLSHTKLTKNIDSGFLVGFYRAL
jgi:hypothetical protein